MRFKIAAGISQQYGIDKGDPSPHPPSFPIKCPPVHFIPKRKEEEDGDEEEQYTGEGSEVHHSCCTSFNSSAVVGGNSFAVSSSPFVRKCSAPQSSLAKRDRTSQNGSCVSLHFPPSLSISFRLLLVCSRVIPGHFIIIRRGKEGPFLSLYSPLIHSNRRGLV